MLDRLSLVPLEVGQNGLQIRTAVLHCGSMEAIASQPHPYGPYRPPRFRCSCALATVKSASPSSGCFRRLGRGSSRAAALRYHCGTSFPRRAIRVESCPFTQAPSAHLHGGEGGVGSGRGSPSPGPRPLPFTVTRAKRLEWPMHSERSIYRK